MKKILFGNKGFGLVEVFVATGVGLVLGLAVLKLSQITISSAQVSSTQQKEQDLYITIRRMLSNEEDCKWNLDPSRLSDRTHKKGKLTGGKYMKTEGNNTPPSPNTSDDILYLATGGFKGDLISVKSLELSNEGSDKYTFAVYYSKPQLGSYKTLGDGECSTTDNKGCYHQSCDLEIVHDPGDNNKITSCSLSACKSIGDSLSVSCSDEQYLSGFDGDGNPRCQEKPTCPPGQVYVGRKADGEEDCRAFPAIPETGNLSCPNADEFLQGFDKDGDPICSRICSGGRIGSNCDCPYDKIWTGVTCKCPTGKIWNKISLKCIVPPPEPDDPNPEPDEPTPEPDEPDEPIICTGLTRYNPDTKKCECPLPEPGGAPIVCVPEPDIPK